jgi:hypothetical protein
VCNNWSALVSADEAARRAAGRRHYNAWRRAIALIRRTELAWLLHVQGGLARTKKGWPDRRLGALGNQAALARQLGVSRSTICRDLQKLLAELHECPTCGAGVRPPGPAPCYEDHSAFVDECLARHREDVRQGILGWAGRGPLPCRAEAARAAGEGEIPDAASGQGR